MKNILLFLLLGSTALAQYVPRAPAVTGTSAFAGAMDQGVATTDSPLWGAATITTVGVNTLFATASGALFLASSSDATIQVNFNAGNIILGGNSNNGFFSMDAGAGSVMSVDASGVGLFASGAISIGDGSGSAAYIDASGNANFQVIGVVGNAFVEGIQAASGAISIGDNSGSLAYIDSGGNAAFAAIIGMQDNFGNTFSSLFNGTAGFVAQSVTLVGYGSFGDTGAGVPGFFGPTSSNSKVGSNDQNTYLDNSGFTGPGVGITTLNASALTSGTAPFARLPIGTSSSTVVVGNDSRIVGAQAAIIRLAGTLTSGTATLSSVAISGSNCWVQDNSSSLTNVGSLTVTTSGTTATIRSTNILDTSPFSLFVKP